jgi:hypothetical protein
MPTWRTIALPDHHGVKAAPVGVGQQAIELRSLLFGAVDAHVHSAEHDRSPHRGDHNGSPRENVPSNGPMGPFGNGANGVCRGAELNCLRRPFQGRALPVSYLGTGTTQDSTENPPH